MTRMGWVGMFLVVAAAGCFGPQNSRRVKAEFSIPPGTLAIVPFREGEGGYFESEAGLAVVRTVGGRLTQAGIRGLKLLDLESIRRILGNTDIDGTKPQELQKRLGADYLLLGHITTLRVKEPKDVNILRGTIVMDLRLIDLRQGTMLWRGSERLQYPKRQPFGFGEDPQDVSPDVIRDGLIVLGGSAVAENFYTHYEEE
ncbi:MAG: hypothetical protein V1809_02570 [Planctomycetota bacterium]